MQRRNFIKHSTIALAGVGALAAMDTSADAKRKPFIHHVFFWLNNADSAADRAALIAGLEKLAKLSVIKAHYISVPANTTRDVVERSYAVSWLCFFDDAAAEEIYQKHPVHQQFVDSCKHLWSKVVVYDSVSPG
jgi:Stress responsive A/B Barrel Domain